MCGTSASFLRLAGGGAIGSSSSMCDPTEDGGERGDGAAALPGRDALGLWLWLALIHSRHTMRQWAGVSEARWKIIYQTRAGCPSRFSRDSGRVTLPGGGVGGKLLAASTCDGRGIGVASGRRTTRPTRAGNAWLSLEGLRSSGSLRLDKAAARGQAADVWMLAGDAGRSGVIVVVQEDTNPPTATPRRGVLASGGGGG